MNTYTANITTDLYRQVLKVMNIAILIYLQDTKMFEEFYTEKAFLNRWDLRAV